MPANHVVKRHRLDVTLDVGLVAWMRARTGAGDPFASEGHALEYCVARLRAEQEHVRSLCKDNGVPFDAAAFWRLYADDIAASKRMGRPKRDSEREDRERVTGGVEVGLVKWMDAACAPQGPFETASHLAETAVRHARSLDKGQVFVLEGFGFDGSALWKDYRKLLGKTVKA